MKKDVRLLELQAAHATSGCNGAMVPKFLFLTSEERLRVAGYCIKCGHDLIVEYDIVESQKMCPSPFDDSDSSIRTTAETVSPKTTALEDFELPYGSKPS